MRIQPASVALGVVLGLLVGVVAGGAGVGALGLFDSPGTPDDGPDPDNPPRSVATGTGCITPTDADTGWAHEVASGTSRAFTANLTVAHAADETVNVTFEAEGETSYVLAVETVEGRDGGDPDCTTGSTVEAAASLPTAYEQVRIVVDGEQVETVENDGETTADLWTFAWNESA